MTGIGRATFLRELCRRQGQLVVWKHLDRALQGRGDVDAAAPPDAVGSIIDDAVNLGPATLGASSVISCTHVADKHLLFFVRHARLPQLFEFDICLQPARGLSPWASPEKMLSLSVLDSGIRRLRPGAEAVVSLVYHGLSARGDDRLNAEEHQIVMIGLKTDLEGALAACRQLAPPAVRTSLAGLIVKFADGKWVRKYARAAWLGFVRTAPAHPVFMIRRVAFRLRLATDQDCVMSRLARRHDRRVPEGRLDQLLEDACAEGHAVVPLS